MKKIQTLALVSGLGLLSTLSNADVTFGGNRSRGMGGAGLALPIDVGQNYRLNPAFLAFGTKTPTFQWPSLGYQLRGVSFGDLSDIVGDLGNGGVNASKVITIAQRFGDTNKVANAYADAGFRVGGFAVGGRGQVGINSIPNASLAAWSASGGGLGTLPLDARLDTYGYGSTQVDVSYGNTIRTKAGKLSLGFSTRTVQSYFAHKIADQNSIQNSNANGVVNGSGVAGDFEKQTSFGLDLGVIYSPPKLDNLYFGMVMENLISPKIDFNFEAPGGGQPITAGGFDPFIRTTSFGVGFMSGDKLLLAADWVDVGNVAGRSETRYGAELALSKSFAIRAGYNSRSAFTYGLSVGGFNVQVGGNTPVTLTSIVRF
jgi:hypothetical protein